jgi:hypothetical protein
VADINVNSRSPEFNAWATMVVVVSIAVLHIEAVISLDARGSTEAFIADFVTNAIRAGGNCQ